MKGIDLNVLANFGRFTSFKVEISLMRLLLQSCLSYNIRRLLEIICTRKIVLFIMNINLSE